MQVFKKRIGRVPFLLWNLGLYLLAPLYFAHAWEHQAFWRYLSEPQGLALGFCRALGDGIPSFFVHQLGAGVSLEMTAPFGLAALFLTLWRCNDAGASKVFLLLACLPMMSLLALVCLGARRSRQPRRVLVRSRRDVLAHHADTYGKWRYYQEEEDEQGGRHIA